MGFYLNSSIAYTLYKNESVKPYFVDKTEILRELFPLVEEGSNYICITRPRRFGKTVTANMIASFFSKGCDSADVFRKLHIAGEKDFEKHLNRHNVIHISFNQLPRECKTYGQYISRIEGMLIDDLKAAYPEIPMSKEEAVWDILTKIFIADTSVRFIFVLDEWDFIFHRKFAEEDDKGTYLEFLNSLLKDRPYVSLAYMTGILPIAKYSSGSELNMFLEYTMATREKYSAYFGFDNEEVDELYHRYLKNTENPHISREGLRSWYDGYQTLEGKRMYNPRSVICALKDNQLGNYWTSSGPYDEIFYYIEKNVADVRNDLALMVSGASVPANVQEYAAVSMNLSTRDEIFSAMAVYGFLSYENGRVTIPNKELMDKFAEMLQKEPSLGYIHQLAKESQRMLDATLSGDTEVMEEILEFAHDTETPNRMYNNEAELGAIVKLVYLSARDYYRIEREDDAGKGYVDFIFYPEDPTADGIILELKVGHTAEEAVRQIKEKNYAARFRPRMGEAPKYTGRILAVGIAYDKASKRHECRVEDIG